MFSSYTKGPWQYIAQQCADYIYVSLKTSEKDMKGSNEVRLYKNRIQIWYGDDYTGDFFWNDSVHIVMSLDSPKGPFGLDNGFLEVICTFYDTQAVKLFEVVITVDQVVFKIIQKELFCK